MDAGNYRGSRRSIAVRPETTTTGGSQFTATAVSVATSCDPPIWSAAILAAHWDKGRLARYGYVWEDPHLSLFTIVKTGLTFLCTLQSATDGLKNAVNYFGLFDYITRYFESLHTNGDRYLVEDFDDFIANHTA